MTVVLLFSNSMYTLIFSPSLQMYLSAQEIIKKIFLITWPWHLPHRASVVRWTLSAAMQCMFGGCISVSTNTADSQLSLHDWMLHTVFMFFHLQSVKNTTATPCILTLVPLVG